jgi:hypothetical protein
MLLLLLCFKLLSYFNLVWNFIENFNMTFRVCFYIKSCYKTRLTSSEIVNVWNYFNWCYNTMQYNKLYLKSENIKHYNTSSNELFFLTNIVCMFFFYCLYMHILMSDLKAHWSLCCNVWCFPTLNKAYCISMDKMRQIEIKTFKITYLKILKIKQKSMKII